ncbi:hypothetical protein AU05_25265 [Ectopseudomonas composti]|uniref:Uncharacterized protein n=1 Tax=Ectopseudomonas composti TaxID=658457 RepID=A0ABP3BRZ1_9GAMM|nr:ABC-three component system middle component 1 [Pseudomonas composti]EZH77244.1 hypothetical protein AU05_25265 [Pseudomonas composti]
MLIKIIENIFLNNGYQIIQLEQHLSEFKSLLFVPENYESREEYFLVIEAITPSEKLTRYILNEGADALFETIRNNQKIDKAFPKNCTMVLCCEARKTPRDLILALEEDHYNFKKNVITYTDEEIQDLLVKLEASGHGKLTSAAINKAINSNSGETFSNFKKLGDSANNYYSLLMKIVIKLPFIQYTPAAQQMDDLEQNIRTNLTPEETSILERLTPLNEGMREEDLSSLLIEIWGNQQ